MASNSALSASSTGSPETVLLSFCCSATEATALNWLLSADCSAIAWFKSASTEGVRVGGVVSSAW